MNSPLTTFIFDCFGVICEPILYGWYKAHQQKTGFVDEELTSTLRQFDLGLLSEENMVEYFMKYEGVTSTREELRNELDNYFKLDEKLLSFMQELKGKGFKICSCPTRITGSSNGRYIPRIRVQGGVRRGSSYPSSVQMVKPNADIFLHALEENRLRARGIALH